MQKVLITGGSGLIGTRLTEMLNDQNYEVRILTRNKELTAQPHYFYWNLDTSEADSKAFEGLDYIIHLAGASVSGGRWTKERKKAILNSRIKSGELLFSKINELGINLKAFVSASGVGFYGTKNKNHTHKESEIRGTDFLAKVCCEWESEAMKFKASGIRTVVLRTGIVLAKNGGALEKMKTPVKFFLGAALGTGKQHMSWIHLDDICRMYIHSIENQSMEGYYNAVTPDEQTNKTFTKALCNAMNRPFIPIPVPGIILHLIFGEMASILLTGNKVSAKKILDSGFQFKFGELNEALEDLV